MERVRTELNFWVTPDSAQGLFLALCSGIILLVFGGLYLVLEIQSRSNAKEVSYYQLDYLYTLSKMVFLDSNILDNFNPFCHQKSLKICYVMSYSSKAGRKPDQ